MKQRRTRIDSLINRTKVNMVIKCRPYASNAEVVAVTGLSPRLVARYARDARRVYGFRPVRDFHAHRRHLAEDLHALAERLAAIA